MEFVRKLTPELEERLGKEFDDKDDEIRRLRKENRRDELGLEIEKEAHAVTKNNLARRLEKIRKLRDQEQMLISELEKEKRKVETLQGPKEELEGFIERSEWDECNYTDRRIRETLTQILMGSLLADNYAIPASPQIEDADPVDKYTEMFEEENGTRQPATPQTEASFKISDDDRVINDNRSLAKTKRKRQEDGNDRLFLEKSPGNTRVIKEATSHKRRAVPSKSTSNPHIIRYDINTREDEMPISGTSRKWTEQVIGLGRSKASKHHPVPELINSDIPSEIQQLIIGADFDRLPHRAESLKDNEDPNRPGKCWMATNHPIEEDGVHVVRTHTTECSMCGLRRDFGEISLCFYFIKRNSIMSFR